MPRYHADGTVQQQDSGWHEHCVAYRLSTEETVPMYDLLFLVLTAAFAVVSILYVFGCEGL